jgi:hypothetical protein
MRFARTFVGAKSSGKIVAIAAAAESTGLLSTLPLKYACCDTVYTNST